ncbi:kininogen-1-like [Scyliorhinus canicula]|uniref:kininogen-1-like n=1 Tax=Scyliorhinus canicula TaxID=7830 RepID=UPI0018F6344F|nr:kininogen-1-like [Scyliorhinus canicula]
MKLLCIAFFTIQLILANAESEPVIEPEETDDTSPYPISCDNPEVFGAVDLTLRKFNAELKDGHQYALHRVIDAEAQGLLGRRYFVEFSIQETDCPVGNGKRWKECGYGASGKASTGHCESNVYIHKTQRRTEVTEHNCTIYSDHHSPIVPEIAPCLGCSVKLPTNHPELNQTVKHAIVKYNAESNYTNYFQQDKVFSFSHQVVAGIKYKLAFSMKESECSKEDSDNISDECDVKAAGIKLFCHSTVFIQSWLNYTHVDVTCDTTPPKPVIFRRFGLAGWGPFSVQQEQLPPTAAAESDQLTSAEEQLSSFLEAPTCPGKLWKPLVQVQTTAPPAEGKSPTQTAFSDSDLEDV